MEILAATPVSLSYLVLGGFVVVFSLVSLLIKEKLYIGEVVLGTAFGVIIGPYCANIFNPRGWGAETNDITLEVMRIVLATGLFAMGVELPGAYIWKHIRSLSIVVVPTMAFGWVVCAGLLKALFPRLNYVSALVISACLTPTDPVLASAILGGKFALMNVPVHIRNLLKAESAANDGMAYPFLTIAVYLTVETSTRIAVDKWILVGCLYQVVFGTVLGALLGVIFSRLMRLSHDRQLIDRESYVAQYLAFAIFTIGIASTLGADDLLAAFAAGTAISWDEHFNERTEDEVFSSVIDLLLNCAGFIYIGAWLPFNTFHSPDLGITPWRLVVLFVAIVVLRRIPAFLLLYRVVPDIKDWKEALFCGHFGPMGVGAVFISTFALAKLDVSQGKQSDQKDLLNDTLQPIVSFIVLCSIIVHGLSIPAFWFGRVASLSISRTNTLSKTLTRTCTIDAGNDVPDWLRWARRVPGVKGEPSSVGVDAIDAMEQGGSGNGTVTSIGKDEHVRVSIQDGQVYDVATGTPSSSSGSATHEGKKKAVVEIEMPGAGDVEVDIVDDDRGAAGGARPQPLGDKEATVSGYLEPASASTSDPGSLEGDGVRTPREEEKQVRFIQ